MKNTKNISDFFKNELCDYSCYSTLRMIASAIDGLKNSQRKIIYTILEKKINSDYKVSQLDGLVQSFTEYLHGSCAGVICNLTSDYIGSNNIPLLKGSGNFGSRFINEPSAPRYIYSKAQKYLNNIFDISDVLIEQNFEGSKIEPMFYVPSIPTLVVNGSPGGIASGFKQHILPRNFKECIKYLTGKKADLNPYFEGFKGKIYKGEGENQYIIEGVFERNKKVITITELPVWIEYKKYLDILENLVDSKKIKDYKDLSDTKTDVYRFEIYGISDLSDESIFEVLKLRKKETEIYNALDRNNQVKTFNSIEEILDYYKAIRLEYLELQKNYDLEKLEIESKIKNSKYKFIKMIIDKKLIINDRKKSDILNDLEKTDLYKNDNYEYLLRMPVHSLTKETLEILKKDIEIIMNEIEILSKKTANDLMILGFENFIKNLNI